MEVNIDLRASGNALPKLREWLNRLPSARLYFTDKLYAKDFNVLDLTLHCMHDRFEATFPPLSPRYYKKDSHVMIRGERVLKVAGTFEYECRLNFDFYNEQENFQDRFINDIIDSLKIIEASRKLKEFDLEKMREEFREYFGGL